MRLGVQYIIKVFSKNINYKLGRPRRRGVDNIKMDLREIGFVGMDWIGHLRTRSTSNSIQCWQFFSSYSTVGFSRAAPLRVITVVSVDYK